MLSLFFFHSLQLTSREPNVPALLGSWSNWSEQNSNGAQRLTVKFYWLNVVKLLLQIWFVFSHSLSQVDRMMNRKTEKKKWNDQNRLDAFIFCIPKPFVLYWNELDCCTHKYPHFGQKGMHSLAHQNIELLNSAANYEHLKSLRDCIGN